VRLPVRVRESSETPLAWSSHHGVASACLGRLPMSAQAVPVPSQQRPDSKWRPRPSPTRLPTAGSPEPKSNSRSDPSPRANRTSAGRRGRPRRPASVFPERVRRRRIRCELHWQGGIDDLQPPEFIRRLAGHPGSLSLRWDAW